MRGWVIDALAAALLLVVLVVLSSRAADTVPEPDRGRIECYSQCAWLSSPVLQDGAWWRAGRCAGGVYLLQKIADQLPEAEL